MSQMRTVSYLTICPPAAKPFVMSSATVMHLNPQMRLTEMGVGYLMQ